MTCRQPPLRRVNIHSYFVPLAVFGEFGDATRDVRRTHHTHRHAHTPGARRPPHHTQTQSSRAWQRSTAMCWSSTRAPQCSDDDADGNTARRTYKWVEHGVVLAPGSDARPPAPSAYYLSLTAAASLSSTASSLKTHTRCALCRGLCLPGLGVSSRLARSSPI